VRKEEKLRMAKNPPALLIPNALAGQVAKANLPRCL